MAESAEFTDEMLEQIFGGNIYESQESFSAYSNKLKQLLDKLSEKYGAEKVLRVTVFNDKFKNLLTDDHADELLDEGVIERQLDIAISEL